MSVNKMYIKRLAWIAGVPDQVAVNCLKYGR